MFDSESNYCKEIRAYAVAVCKDVWRMEHRPVGIKELVERIRTIMVHELRDGVWGFPVPPYETVKRRVNECNEKGLLVWIGRHKILGFEDSCYIPQPLEYTGEERVMLERLMPRKVEQGSLW